MPTITEILPEIEPWQQAANLTYERSVKGRPTTPTK
jgi:hypothetical protein